MFLPPDPRIGSRWLRCSASPRYRHLVSGKSRVHLDNTKRKIIGKAYIIEYRDHRLSVFCIGDQSDQRPACRYLAVASQAWVLPVPPPAARHDGRQLPPVQESRVPQLRGMLGQYHP